MRPEQRTHVSGLVLQHATAPYTTALHQRHTLNTVPMCPRSGNPKSGTVVIEYAPADWCLEVYSLERMLWDTLPGGFEGAGPYAPDRNMEGAMRLLAQMCADALEVEVRLEADLELHDIYMPSWGKHQKRHRLELSVEASPQGDAVG